MCGDRLREALERLVEHKNDYPTDLSRSQEWEDAFARAREALAAGRVSSVLEVTDEQVDRAFNVSLGKHPDARIPPLIRDGERYANFREAVAALSVRGEGDKRGTVGVPPWNDADPYTMAARLCGDDGMVRRGAMHHGTDYPCTGHAHFAGEHIRCISAGHPDGIPSEALDMLRTMPDNLDPARSHAGRAARLRLAEIEGSGSGSVGGESR